MESTGNIDQVCHLYGGFALGMIAVMAFFAVTLLLLTIFWVWMLVDCANSPMNTSDKTAWILIILFTHILGAALYFFIPRNERLRTARPSVAREPSDPPLMPR